jgi:hexosaminidase
MNKLVSTHPETGEGLLHIDYDSAGALAPALRKIAAEYPGRFTDGPEGQGIAFRREAGNEAFRVEAGAQACTIHYTSIPSALRGLSAVMGDLLAGRAIAPISEETPFASRGIMVDTSRNGVPLISTLENLIRRIALMGLNHLYLYCEDTIRLPSEPFLGYFRGGYSHEELKALDDYAADFGIEIIPCIQVLGHMEQALQWPAYWQLRDTPKVLLVDAPETYDYLAKLIAAATAPFRSKRIHIGMDEAHGVGSGVYRQRNGQCRPFDILASHLGKVAGLCKAQGLDPMIWSDMFFRLGSRTNNYYDRDSRITGEIAQFVPDSVRLVYWDYYHYEEEFYDEWVRRHQQLGQTPIFATGVWTWNRFWTELPHSFATIAPGMAAARRHGISEVFATMWGDDGTECDILSALPGLEFFAGQCFGTAEEALPCRFRGSCDADWNAWCSVSALDHTDNPAEGEAGNLSKLLLWHDPLLGFFEKHIPAHLQEHYSRLSAKWEAAASLPGFNTRLQHPARIADALSLKATLHETLRPAYQAGDREALSGVVKNLIPRLQIALTNLQSSHYLLWHEVYQPFGWDVVDRRYGGLRSRIETLSFCLTRHLETGARIPELELVPLTVASPQQWSDVIISHARTASPSAIA